MSTSTTPPHLSKNNSAVLLDKDWVRTSFMLPHVPNSPTVGQMSEEDKKWLYYSTANHKFTSTGLGGNYVLNAPPKYTRYADIPSGIWVDGVITESSLNKGKEAPARDRSLIGGMGRYYSEAIDDNSYNVYLRFGMPEYKGLITFFTGFYDIDASQLAREGRTNWAFLVGKLIGTVVALPALPAILAYKAARMILATPSTKYYTSKPTMPLYWNRVNMIASSIAMNKGLIPRGRFLAGNSGKSMYEEYDIETPGVTKESARNQFEQLQKIVPDWFTGTVDGGGGLDIQKIIGRPQAVANRTRAELQKIFEGSNDPATMQNAYETYATRGGVKKSIRSSSIDKYLSAYFDSRLGNVEMGRTDPYAEQMRDRLDNPDAAADGAGATDDGGGNISEGAAAGEVYTTAGGEAGQGIGKSQYDDLARGYADEDGLIFPVLKRTGKTDDKGNEVFERTPPHFDDPSLMELIDNRYSDDLQWLILRVDAVDTVSESFSNSTTQSEIQQKINGMSSSNQAARFSLSDFKTGFGGIDTVIKTVKDTISGVASGLQLDGLVSLTGAGFVDIPERYDDSASDFPSSSYTMQLRAPYGDLLSQFINIDVPLSCMLAAALPISHGNQSYGAPFLCEMYVPGKNVIRMGLIDSLSVTRGTGNMGWSPDGSPLGVDISFSIKDLSTIMHAPIDVAGSKWWNPFAGLLPRDSAFHDYLSVLGNMSVHGMTTQTDRFRTNLALKKNIYRNMMTPGHVVSTLFDTKIGRVAREIRAEQHRTNEALNRRTGM